MKQRILLLIVLTAALGSCSVYKNGQTPDDVYYSPAREYSGYINPEDDARNNEATSPEDRYLRMKSINRSRWSAFDDDVAYWNNPSWNNSWSFNSMGSPYYYSPYYNPWVGTGWNLGIGYSWGWNSFGGIWNPFCPSYYGTPIVVVNPKTVNYKSYAPRGTNLNTYSRSNVYTNPKTGERVYGVSSGNASSATLRTYRSGGSYYSTSGSNRTSGGSPSRSFNSNSSNNSYRSSGNTNSGSSGGSRSSGSSGGGSAPVRSFPRGGGK